MPLLTPRASVPIPGSIDRSVDVTFQEYQDLHSRVGRGEILNLGYRTPQFIFVLKDKPTHVVYAQNIDGDTYSIWIESIEGNGAIEGTLNNATRGLDLSRRTGADPQPPQRPITEVAPPIVAPPPPPPRVPEPKRINPLVVEANAPRGIDTLPLSAVIGEDSLAPYAWIILKGDETREAQYEINLGANLDKGAPTRHGLRSMRIMNENGKYPTVEFDLYVPEYRKGGPNDDLDLARPLQKFRVGAEFSIKWGYRDAHTRWGLFRVMERDIQFSQGTALLSIKAKMGYKMSSTVTADVFSTTFGVSAIDKMARLIELPVDLSNTLAEEYEELLTKASTAVPSGGTLSSAIYKEAQKRDLEMMYDPEQDSLKLVTPFKLDLIPKGAKPVKMTYGFPNSPIQSLLVETKHPKKSGRGARSTKGVTRGLMGASIDEKSGTLTQIVKGSLRVAGETNVFLNFGYVFDQDLGLPPPSLYLGNSAFPNGPNNTVQPEKELNTTASHVIANAERVYPPNQGYIVSINSDLNVFAPPSKSGYFHVIVQRKFKIPKSWVVTRDDKRVYRAANEEPSLRSGWADAADINSLSMKAEAGKLGFIIQDKPARVGGKLRYPVKVYKVDPTKVDGAPPRGGAKEEVLLTSSTIKTEPKARLDNTPEGEEFYDIKLPDRPPESFIGSVALRLNQEGKDIPPLLKNQIKRFEALESKLQKEAKEKGQRIIRRDLGVTTTLVLQARRPTETNQKAESAEQNVDTASVDTSAPRPDAQPLGVTSGKARPSRRLSLMTIRIRMKAGDWTLKTGKLVEIVDVYESINGIYYIHGEEHTIGDSGFHTEIVCKKATSKQIAQYGTTKRVRKGTRKPTSGEKGDSAKASRAKLNTGIETQTSEVVNSIKVARESAEERERRFKRDQRSNLRNLLSTPLTF